MDFARELMDLTAAFDAQCREAARKNKVTQKVAKAKWKGFASDSLGVVGHTREDAVEAYKKAGVSVDFDQQGRALITGPKQYEKLRKIHDCDHGRWT